MAWFKKLWGMPDLRNRVLLTIALLLVCRVGAFVPVPGINGTMAAELFKNGGGSAQNLFQLMDVFSGGAFAQMTVVALGVMPYISASIIMQLLMALVPSLQKEIREHPEYGRRKLSRWTRLLTLGLAFFQSALFAKYALRLNLSMPGVVLSQLIDWQIFGVSWLFMLVVMSAMTAGTLLLMWIGEQITEKGVGNGISLIIAVGILSSLPTALGSIIRQLRLDSQEPGPLNFFSLGLLSILFVGIVAATILIIQGQRKIPLQYARRMVGVREVQGRGMVYLPLKVNYAGVIPVIFASSLLMFPMTIGQFLGNSSWIGRLAGWMTPGSPLYLCLYVSLIIFFTYFWTATQFHPQQIASEMKRSGAFIPGIRQGKPTQDYLESTMGKITLGGALFLAAIAIAPSMIGALLGVDSSVTCFFGGTSSLILVGVVMDTQKQIASQMLMKQYDGFMRRSMTEKARAH